MKTQDQSGSVDQSGGSVGCLFCSIAAHTEPASLIYEDDHILAFLDIRPVRPGQLLVIPRRHIDHFCDLPDDLATRMLLLGQRLARVLRARAPALRAGMVVHGFGVPHAHLVVLPLHHAWDITSSANAYQEDGAVKFRWEQVPLTPRSQLDALATELADQLAALPSQ